MKAARDIKCDLWVSKDYWPKVTLADQRQNPEYSCSQERDATSQSCFLNKRSGVIFMLILFTSTPEPFLKRSPIHFKVHKQTIVFS